MIAMATSFPPFHEHTTYVKMDQNNKSTHYFGVSACDYFLYIHLLSSCLIKWQSVPHNILLNNKIN